MTSGCFHILHPGHVELFEYCSKIGTLYVGINTDEYLLEKSKKVLVKLVDRIYLLNSIKFIDKVIPFSERDACSLIRKVIPDIFVKGSDYLNIDIPEKVCCEEMRIKYMICPLNKKYNTSNLIS